MDIRTKNVRDLTATEYRACLGATFGNNGWMREELENCRTSIHHDGIAIMLWDGPNNRAGSMKGWALLTPVRTWGAIRATRYTKTRSKYTVMFYVKKINRKQGYGKLLMAEVKKHDQRPHVFPHSTASSEFFSSYEVTVLKEDAGWYKRGKPKLA